VRVRPPARSRCWTRECTDAYAARRRAIGARLDPEVAVCIARTDDGAGCDDDAVAGKSAVAFDAQLGPVELGAGEHHAGPCALTAATPKATVTPTAAVLRQTPADSKIVSASLGAPSSEHACGPRGDRPRVAKKRYGREWRAVCSPSSGKDDGADNTSNDHRLVRGAAPASLTPSRPLKVPIPFPRPKEVRRRGRC
jgi:hypothetical protein